MSDSDLTPHGRMLEQARKDRVAISGREAARRASISEGRWRQVVLGYQSAGGQRIPVKPTLRTLVAMAVAVDVDPWEVVQVAGLEPAPNREAVNRIARTARMQGQADATVRPQTVRATAAVPTPTVVTHGVDEEIELVRADPNLSDQKKVQIIGLIYARRTREKESGMEDTRRMIEIIRDQAAG